MKPHRLALTHSLVLNYGLYKKMEVCKNEKNVLINHLYNNIISILNLVMLAPPTHPPPPFLSGVSSL